MWGKIRDLERRISDAWNQAKQWASKIASYVNFAKDAANKVKDALSKVKDLPDLVSSLPDKLVQLIKDLLPWLPTSGMALANLISYAVTELLGGVNFCYNQLACTRFPDKVTPSCCPPLERTEVLEWPYTAGGAPPAPTKGTIAGKKEMYHWENLVGPFLVHKLPPPI